jgi:hypothetical protein
MYIKVKRSKKKQCLYTSVMAGFALNPLNILTILTTLINNHYPPQSIIASTVNGAEQMLADKLFDIIVSSVNDPVFEVQQEIVDDLSSTSEYPGAQLVDVEEDDNVNYNIDEEMDVIDQEQEPPDAIDIDNDYKRAAVEYWKSGKKGRYSLKTVAHRYRKVTSLPQLRRWEQQVSSGGTRRQKLFQLSQYVFNQFKVGLDRQMIIHDYDLRRWASEAQKELQIPNFIASESWIQRFKNKHNIVSRKITKFRTRMQVSGAANVAVEAVAFVRSIHNILPDYGVENVYNTDQSGFNIEMHTGRTLAERGSKSVEAVVQSITATTHSYTIQPTLSAAGELMSPLFVCLKETKGSLGPLVQKHMFRPPNVYIAASKSGKLTKNLVIQWAKDVYAPHVGKKTLLLMDSWSGQSPEDISTAVPADHQVTVMTIPKGATGIIQPLDVYFFRSWKQFIRQLSDIIVLSAFAVQLYQRDNILRLQGLTHLQFSSPRYKEMRKYAWYKSGYLEEHPAEFVTPLKFSFQDSQMSHCDECGEPAIIRCGWCKKYLCIKHFFVAYHNCGVYNQ